MSEKDKYELRVAEQPNAAGFYVAEFYKNGLYVGVRVGGDRDEAIRRARQWVDDDRGITYETITL